LVFFCAPAKDENGKIHIVPMKLPKCITSGSAGKKDMEQSSSVKRKFIPIGRHILTPGDFEGSPKNLLKKRKIDKPVCKELFKVPQSKKDKRFSSLSRRSSIANNFSTNKINSKKINVVKKSHVFNGDTPLVDVDEAEKFLTKRLMQKPVVLFPITSIQEDSQAELAADTPPKILLNDETQHTPTSGDSLSEREFLHLEKILASARKLNNISESASPMSSMCALLENTRLTNSGKKHKNHSDPVFSEILNLIKQDEEQFQLLKQQFECYQVQRQSGLNRIAELLNEINENKENTNRRSIRIAAQGSAKSKILVSPVISKSIDLRKSTLNKNLSKNLEV
jgi:hypothetical protein